MRRQYLNGQIQRLRNICARYAVAHYKGERSLREFCNDLIRTQNVDSTLKRVYRVDLETLEERFIADIG